MTELTHDEMNALNGSNEKKIVSIHDEKMHVKIDWKVDKLKNDEGAKIESIHEIHDVVNENWIVDDAQQKKTDVSNVLIHDEKIERKLFDVLKQEDELRIDLTHDVKNALKERIDLILAELKKNAGLTTVSIHDETSTKLHEKADELTTDEIELNVEVKTELTLDAITNELNEQKKDAKNVSTHDVLKKNEELKIESVHDEMLKTIFVKVEWTADVMMSALSVKIV